MHFIVKQLAKLLNTQKNNFVLSNFNQVYFTHFKSKTSWLCRIRARLTALPWPGFEPGLSRPQREVLTTIRSRPSRQLAKHAGKCRLVLGAGDSLRCRWIISGVSNKCITLNHIIIPYWLPEIRHRNRSREVVDLYCSVYKGIQAIVPEWMATVYRWTNEWNLYILTLETKQRGGQLTEIYMRTSG